MKYMAILLFSIILLIGCSIANSDTQNLKQVGNPTAEQILTQNKDADIFMLDDIVYSNAENNEWVKEVQLTLNEQVGEVTKQFKEGMSFENGMATVLPIGTMIYAPKERRDILIARIKDKEIRYLGLREG